MFYVCDTPWSVNIDDTVEIRVVLRDPHYGQTQYNSTWSASYAPEENTTMCSTIFCEDSNDQTLHNLCL